MRVVIFSMAIVSAIFLTSCEDAEDRKIASAQKCLNGLSDTATTEAQTCIDIVGDLDSEQANIIKCSGSFIVGGLNNTKVVTAFNSYKNATVADKEATLIKNLSLGAGNNGLADTAFNYCNKTGIPGLAYVASLCRIGTFVDQYAGADIDAQIATIIGDSGASALEDKEEIAEMVNMLSSLYCQGEAKESNICIEIFTAQQAAGGNATLLADTLLQQFLN